MEITSGVSGFARLLLLTVVSFFALNYLSLLLIPEHGCLSVRGIYWAFVHIAFLLTTGVMMGAGKLLTVRKLVFLFVGYALFPFAITSFFYVISLLV